MTEAIAAPPQLQWLQSVFPDQTAAVLISDRLAGPWVIRYQAVNGVLCRTIIPMGQDSTKIMRV